MDASVSRWQMCYRDITLSLHQQGLVDSQFTEVKRLQDEDSPDFVSKIFSIYFEDCEKIIADIVRILSQNGTIDYKVVSANAHQLKGSSTCIGAKRIKDLCVAFKKYCDAQDLNECRKCVDKVDAEYTALKIKIHYLFNLEKRILQAGGRVPKVI